jgi:hypothetical protein
MITAYRTTRHGAGIDAYEVVELLKDGEWVHGETFYEYDNYMCSNMSKYIGKVKRAMQVKHYSCINDSHWQLTVKPDELYEFGTDYQSALAFMKANKGYRLRTEYKD